MYSMLARRKDEPVDEPIDIGCGLFTRQQIMPTQNHLILKNQWGRHSGSQFALNDQFQKAKGRSIS